MKNHFELIDFLIKMASVFPEHAEALTSACDRVRRSNWHIVAMSLQAGCRSANEISIFSTIPLNETYRILNLMADRNLVIKQKATHPQSGAGRPLTTFHPTDKLLNEDEID